MIVVVFGRRGSGKTTHIYARLQRESRALIYDPLFEYHSFATVHSDLGAFVDDLDRKRKGVFRIALAPINVDDDAAFDMFLRCAWVVGNVTVVCDEIDYFASAVSVPDSLRKLIRYGRHRKVSMIAAARRAASVPRDLTSQADLLISFNQSEPNDTAYLREYVGIDLAKRIASLPPYRCIAFDVWTRTAKDLDSREYAVLPSQPSKVRRKRPPADQPPPAQALETSAEKEH